MSHPISQNQYLETQFGGKSAFGVIRKMSPFSETDLKQTLIIFSSILETQ